MIQSYAENPDQHESRWRWAFAAAILVLLTSGGLAIRQYVPFSEATRRVEHTYQVLSTIDDVREALLDAEAGQRGYLLTGAADYLGPFQSAAPRVAGLAAQLESLVADNPAQAARARQLGELSRDKIAELQGVIDQFQRGQRTEAVARVSAGDGRRAMEAIRRVSNEMGAAEQSLLEQRAAEARLARRASVGFGLVSVLIAAALAVAAGAIGRSFEQRRMALEREMRKRRNAEESAASAEQELAQLLASERAARSEAERSTHIKDEFLSTLSHELRTPLNAIVGWVSVLKQDRTRDTMVKAIDVIDRNSRRQTRMIDDLLDVSRIVSGKMRLDIQQVDLGAVIEEAIASAQPGADAKGVRLITRLGTSALVQGDAARLQQVVWNLVSNAIKFSGRGGMVQVTLSRAVSHAQLRVSDTGQGIAPELLPYIFQRFRQGDSSATRRHGGLGLGLAIVENLVEMHGGTVEAASDGAGLGAQFTVRLPLAVSSARRLEADSPDAHAPIGDLLRGIVAMVIDDEPDARDLVQRLLEDAGARVSGWTSAQEALQSMRDGFLPDVIVSDIGMPDQDGYDFISHVRQMPGPAAAVPAAALTALARVQDRRRALRAGYQTHLAKPVDPAELVATVASLARRTGQRRA